MSNRVFVPNPINTDDIMLPDSITGLIELLAQNNHDIWASERVKQGWIYGNERDDNKREHPCLVPYEDLPEDEKEYDRNTAIGILKLIIKLGYKIEMND